MVFMGKGEMATVVTALLDTIYGVRLNNPQCFEVRICLRLQVEWESLKFPLLRIPHARDKK
jgi:hypothetical protein